MCIYLFFVVFQRSGCAFTKSEHKFAALRKSKKNNDEGTFIEVYLAHQNIVFSE